MCGDWSNATATTTGQRQTALIGLSHFIMWTHFQHVHIPLDPRRFMLFHTSSRSDHRPYLDVWTVQEMVILCIVVKIKWLLMVLLGMAVVWQPGLSASSQATLLSRTARATVTGIKAPQRPVTRIGRPDRRIRSARVFSMLDARRVRPDTQLSTGKTIRPVLRSAPLYTTNGDPFLNPRLPEHFLRSATVLIAALPQTNVLVRLPVRSFPSSPRDPPLPA
jgi:hypothetical protein